MQEDDWGPVYHLEFVAYRPDELYDLDCASHGIKYCLYSDQHERGCGDRMDGRRSLKAVVTRVRAPLDSNARPARPPLQMDGSDMWQHDNNGAYNVYNTLSSRANHPFRMWIDPTAATASVDPTKTTPTPLLHPLPQDVARQALHPPFVCPFSSSPCFLVQAHY